MVARLADLHEEDAAPEVVDDLLGPPRVPPLGGEVVFSAGHHDPEGQVLADDLPDLRVPGFLDVGDVKVPLEERGADRHPELAAEVLGESVDEVERGVVAPVDERVVRPDHADAGVLLLERGDPGIVLPQGRAGGADVRDESARVGEVKVPHRGGEHHHVARGLEVPEDDLPLPGHGRPPQKLLDDELEEGEELLELGERLEDELELELERDEELEDEELDGDDELDEELEEELDDEEGLLDEELDELGELEGDELDELDGLLDEL